MFLSFMFTTGFSLAYTVYWMLGAVGLHVAGTNQPVTFDNYGKITSYIYMAQSGIFNLSLVCYMCILKAKFNMTKDQVME